MSVNHDQANVPYFVHEGQMARMERIMRTICIVFLIALLIVSSALVINDCYWRSYCTELEVRYDQSPGVHQQHSGYYPMDGMGPYWGGR